MNKALLGTLAALAVIPATVALACTSDGQRGIAPENNLYIPASRLSLNSNTKEDFLRAVAKSKKVYEPIFTRLGLDLVINADWEDGTVNAYAEQEGRTASVYMFGGLARHTKTTPDGFMLVICHEMGHHIGGAPRIGARWASNEGQSDYFASLKCAREIWKDENNASIVANMEIPQIVTERCQKGFDSAEEIAICKRAAMAGKSLADLLGDLGRSGDTDFMKPDPSVVRTMDNSHPDAQCRLDTYFAGSVCNKSKDVGTSTTDPTVGTCAQEKGEVLGIRPLCWYLPVRRTPDPDPTPTPTPTPTGGSSWPSSRVQRRAGR